MDFNEIKSISDKYLMPTYNHFPVALASGKNATLTASDGREIIDFTSGIGVNIFGVNDDTKGLFQFGPTKQQKREGDGQYVRHSHQGCQGRRDS